MPIQPELASDRLIGEINALSKSGSISFFDSKRFRRAAEKIKTADAAGAYTVLGMIDCLEWNIDDMRANHERAMRAAPFDVLVSVNYATSLDRTHFSAESYDIWSAAWKRQQDDPELVDMCIYAAVDAGKISAALEHLHFWEKLNPGKEHQLARFTRTARGLMKERGVSDNQFSELMEATGTILRENRIAILRTAYEATVEDGGMINIESELAMDPESIADLNVSIAEYLVAHGKSEWPSLIVCSLAPGEPQEKESGSEP